MRLIEAIFPEDRLDAVTAAVEKYEPTHWRFTAPAEDGMQALRAFFAADTAQGLVDELQNICAGGENWRILVLPVEATAPQPEPDEKEVEEKARRKRLALREEIYDDVAAGARLSADFLLLTFASTIVAALGVNADNIAAVIGAMVIAPLLGPILAFSFATALGDFGLLSRAARNALAGLALGVAVAGLMGVFIPPNFESNELMSRTVVGLDSIVLGLAAGAAAALSVVAGVSAALVGVMVAVALLPPAAAAGLFLGAGEFSLALRAALLLTVNVVCIMIAAQAVYIYKGVRPRTWFEQQKAGRASMINLGVLAALLLGLAAVIVLSPAGVMPEMPGSDGGANDG